MVCLEFSLLLCFSFFFCLSIKCNIDMHIHNGEGPKQNDENNCLKGKEEAIEWYLCIGDTIYISLFPFCFFLFLFSIITFGL